MSDGLGLIGRRFGAGAIERARQEDLERRAAAVLAVDPDVAAVLLDDAVAGGEAEAGALARRLGREERLEQVARHLLGHAHAGVADREHHVLARQHALVLARVVLVELDVLGLDRQHAAVRHGVARVDHQVHQHLLELRRIEPHAAEAARRDDAQLDVLADDAAQQVLHLHDEPVQVDDPRLGDLPAREGEELPRQRGAALGRAADAAEVVVRRVVASASFGVAIST